MGKEEEAFYMRVPEGRNTYCGINYAAATLMTILLFGLLLTGCAEPASAGVSEIVSQPAASAGVSEIVSQPAASAVLTPDPSPAALPASSATATPAPTEQPEPQSVTMLFAGDIMDHKSQQEYHRVGSSYDFTSDYINVRDIISAADISAVNLETVLSGERPYTGFPRFNSPDNLADALTYAGFDVVATANNHALDKGSKAMKRTSSYLRGLGFTVIGTAASENDTKYALVEKNGIKVGFVNFSYTTNLGYPNSDEPYLNCLKRGKDCEKGYAAMSEEIKALKSQGADFIVAFMHWGSQYQLKNNKKQQEEARRIADMGVDLIIGAHPHVLQNAGEYTSPVTGKNTLIYYSLGNFMGNSPYDYGAGKGNNTTGAMALIRLARGSDGSVAINSAGFITTYILKPRITVKYTDRGKEHSRKTRAFYIVPAVMASENPPLFEGAEGTQLKQLRQGVKNGGKMMGKPGETLKLFDFREYTDWPW
jgi:poly-gamma-glutamate capsule biosynthesis protein CapA/YwtB (metallophosphatase superfamily)